MNKIYKQSLKTKVYKVSGMHCASCATMLELDLEDAGIKASCSYAKEELKVDDKHDKKKIIEIIKKSGYSVS